MEQLVFPFADTRPTAVRSLQQSVLAAVAAGRSVILDVDGLPALDNPALQGLILILRRVREAGGTLLLRVTRPELLSTLRLTALDRVFSFTCEAEGAFAC